MATEREILESYRTLVIVGVTSDTKRPGYIAPNFMRGKGYRIIGVNPSETEIAGEKVYPDLASIPEPVEMVVVFRRAEQAPAIAREAVAAGAKVLWLQQGIISPEARQIAEDAGMTYVEDRCIHCVVQESGG